MKIAFLILAHKQIELVYKTIDTLSSPGNQFFVHLDRKYNPRIQDKYLKNENVHFLKDRLNVNWGGFNIVRATLALMIAAYRSENFDYFILLSGQCFPIKPVHSIEFHLEKNNGNIYMENYKLPLNWLTNGGFDKYQYHYFFDGLVPLSTNFKKMIFKWTKTCEKFLGIRRKLPDNLQPYYGSQWWGLPNSAVDYIIQFVKSHPEVIHFFKYTWAPDELFFQTILSNSEFQHEITGNNLHYIDWNTNGPPKTLTMNYYSELKQSEFFFARKFDIEEDKEIINYLSNEDSDLDTI